MLRYPGGKLRLMPKINELIKQVYPEAYTSDWVVSEPFVGGGGSLINMAEDFPLWKFIVNDTNKEIASLWKFFKVAKDNDFDLLYEKIRTQKVDLETYKTIFDSKPDNNLDGAFRIIFLNKTSYNGYVTEALPIGGWNQSSKWNVDVYWTPKNIIRKIERARRALTDKILSVSTEDFEKFLNNTSHFVYCDPPYITYGQQWYSCEFGMEGLSRLKKSLQNKERWCISIDRHPETEKIFNDCVRLGIDVKHTAKSSYKSKREDKSIALSNEIVVFPPPPWWGSTGLEKKESTTHD